jgi:hypothetical protein
MATISKTGIQDGLTSKAEHLTRIIDALDGTATADVVVTGAFSIFGDVTTSFSGSKNVVMPATQLSNSSTVSLDFTALPAGGYVFVDLSGANTVTLTLPTAAATYYGYEWNIGVSAAGGAGDMTIAGGASKIYGTIAAVSNPVYFNAASTLTVDSGTSVIGNSLTIRGMGTAGWLLTGTFRNGNTIT